MASKSKARPAFVFLSLIAAFLVIALLMCLPSGGGEKEPAQGAAQTEEGGRTPRPAGLGSPVSASGGSANSAPERLAEQTRNTPATAPEIPRVAGRMAVIIDDAGYSLDDLQPFLDYPGPLAVAVLPNLPSSEETARRVLAAGKTLLLHCPMEPLSGGNPGPGALRTDHTDAELESLLESALASVPGAVGVNNHMGSRATADDRLMSVVFSFLEKKGLFYIDSRTTIDSVGARIAARYSVPFLERDVFMDNERSENEIRKSIIAGITEAETRGSAVLIGHIHTPQILAILKSEEQAFRDAEIRIAGLNEIFESEKGTVREDTRN
jgi:polysaccharide deacetylase 2 family uncharacterized protein YibQ